MSTVMAEALEIPHWVNRFLVFLLVAFAPIVIGFSWVYELTPEGFKRAAEVEQNAALSGRTARRLDIAIIALMVVLAGLYIGERFLPGAEHRQEAAAGEGAPAHEAQPAAAASGISIAVLPFLNLSRDPDQEFFSDGMTEEITSALAKVKGLRVVGRTSAFEFKGQNKDLRAIGKALSASHVLEGSVRKEGNQIRVTAQLIRADDGTHIWTDNYDRELKSVFAIQDEISQAIAGALRVPLGLGQGESLVASRTIDTETYQEYLRARAVWRARGSGRGVPEVIEMLEPVVLRDPSYAPAWALLAQAYAGNLGGQGTVEEVRRGVATRLQKSEAAALRALELDPRNADAYVGLGFARQGSGKFLEAEDLYKQAMKLDPLNPDLLHFYSQAALFSGRVKDAVAMRQKLQTVEPLSPNLNQWTSLALQYDGQYEAALTLAIALPSNFTNRYAVLARIYGSMGRYGEAADALQSALVNLPNAGALLIADVGAAVPLFRMAPAVVAPKDLPNLQGNLLPSVYLYVGAPERAFQIVLDGLQRAYETGYAYPVPDTWHPSYASMRKTERFKTLMRKLGLVDYWRARGWPDHCHPVGKDDFECS